jgi:hypothetical protein
VSGSESGERCSWKFPRGRVGAALQKMLAPMGRPAALRAPRSRRGAEALWQPAGRCAPLGVCGDGSAEPAGLRGRGRPAVVASSTPPRRSSEELHGIGRWSVDLCGPRQVSA